MALRNILVHLAEDKRCHDRLALACDLAAKQDGLVTGLFVRPYPITVPEMADFGAASVVEDLEETYDAWAQRAKETFTKATTAKGIPAEWREDRGGAEACLAYQARYADMAVVGQWSPDDPTGPGILDLGGLLALDAGRPVLSVPYAGTFSSDWKRIMVAWDSSREATRAVHDAMDFLKTADRVDVICVDPEDSAGRDPGADIAAHLARHGVAAEAHRMASGSLSTADTLISATSDMGSDLLVMGAYGHSRLAEIIFGGVTSVVMKHMPVPVLMSN